MKEPNFFIIGAPKCGTTSMAAWLAEHPDIYMSPIKEPHFFCRDFNPGVIISLAEYEQLFKEANKEHMAVGEASTSYLSSKVAVSLIEELYPNARYIVMVRNPVEMSYSLYEEYRCIGTEHIRDFKVAWKLSPERRQGRSVTKACKVPQFLDYQLRCCIGEQLERLFKIVPRERVLVLVLDDIRKNPRREYLKVLDFLGVPDDGRMEFPTKNPAKERRWPALRKITRFVGGHTRSLKRHLGIPIYKGTGILEAIDNINLRYRPRSPLPEDFLKELVDYYREDVEKLSRLIGRDLSHWLTIEME